MALRPARANDAVTVPVETTANPFSSVDIIAAPTSLRLPPHQLRLQPKTSSSTRFADVETTSASYYAPADVKIIPAVEDVPVPSETTAFPYAVETATGDIASDRTYDDKENGLYLLIHCLLHRTYHPSAVPARLVFDKAGVICDCTEIVKKCQHAPGNDEKSGSGDESSGYAYETTSIPVETTTVAVYTRTAPDVPSTTTTQAYETNTDAYTTTTQAETTTIVEATTTAADVPSTAQDYENYTITTTAVDVPSTTTPLKNKLIQILLVCQLSIQW
ncbi:hypothetical protein GCK72_023066 [Caenorhabditis remanei]|uniref:Uncharacterized protein n=1 Tax=Caenorhabditis remanei TaxID=31234 RepID=A0A6A5FW13_CAERE|nr:hypothetical protein GCK72_023066 [Caenorhabditis remanei]KAF1746609.1 hypothetical protein GCK72_023066 [Caenorhabditis remanei]